MKFRNERLLKEFERLKLQNIKQSLDQKDLLRENRPLERKTVKEIKTKGLNLSEVSDENKEKQNEAQVNYRLLMHCYTEVKKSDNICARPLLANNEDLEDIKHQLDIDDKFLLKKMKDSNSTQLIALIECLIDRINQKNSIINFCEVEIESLTQEIQDLNEKVEKMKESNLEELINIDENPCQPFLTFEGENMNTLENVDSKLENEVEA